MCCGTTRQIKVAVIIGVSNDCLDRSSSEMLEGSGTFGNGFRTRGLRLIRQKLSSQSRRSAEALLDAGSSRMTIQSVSPQGWSKISILRWGIFTTAKHANARSHTCTRVLFQRTIISTPESTSKNDPFVYAGYISSYTLAHTSILDPSIPPALCSSMNRPQYQSNSGRAWA
ncbi:hypothetical protein HO173_009237 [Letharia columbiana]|uniref:Uncharacterized protein n=1 Tax=Letharia columbiana TaxID=112416 RepID=A0A8H6L224_9LECA|nr:uncharacterized protein HO173_009237 [Letharia columbiana]KAF6232569.1 hypothetical protein HO173_009237 [Letharia columbiana]